MNKFNLTFSGEILSDQKPDEVKQRFAKAFSITDRARLERFFSGETITLRRNLERKAAAQCFQEMREIGIVAELVKLTSDQLALDESARRRRREESGRRQETNEEAEKERQLQRQETQGQRREAEEAARRDREKREREAAEKTRRKQAAEENAAKKRAEEERRQKLAAEAAARKAAERERKAAERERLKAQREAEKAAQARRKAEQQAKEREARAEAKRKAEEEKARREEEAAARRRATQEEAARRKAAEDERRAREAQRKAEKEAAERARREQEKRETAARAKALAEQQEKERREVRKLREQEARRKQELAEQQARQRILEEIQQRRAEEEAEKQRKMLEEQAISKGARELARGAAIKPVAARVKTRLEVPQRNIVRRASDVPAPKRKRQIGEPNLYSLKAFRVTSEVRQRQALARRNWRRGTTVVCLALCALLAILALQEQWQAPAPVTGAEALAADNSGALFLLADGLLLRHNRAGIAEEKIDLAAPGISDLHPPLVFAVDNTLLALAQSAQGFALARCDLTAQSCATWSTPAPRAAPFSFQAHPLNGSLFTADSNTGELMQIDAQGEIIGRATLALPASPHLILHNGLLFINSAAAPAISVYRYDRDAFAQQLDEILLLPEAAVAREHSAVGQFLRAGEHWWVVMYNAESRSAGLYRFDDEWNFVNEIPLETPALPVYLTAWGDRVLVNQGRELDIARYNHRGQAEAPFSSESLGELSAERKQAARIRRLTLGGGLLLALFIGLIALALAYINRLRMLVFKPKRDRGAQPIDDYADTLNWIPPAPGRENALKRRAMSYAVLALATCLLAMGAGASALQLGALLLALSGPLVALLILLRSPVGHIGVADKHLLLVNHDDLYHFGSGSEIQYRGSYLMLYDVVVFCGNHFVPAFSRSQLNQQITPVVSGGVKVDRKTLLVRLIEHRHPVYRAFAAIIISSCAALALLIVPALFLL